jgi:hypothetical protein
MSHVLLHKTQLDNSLLKYMKANDIGLNFLLRSSYGDAFYYVESVESLYEAVQKLQTHYGGTDTVYLLNLLQEFQNCTPPDDDTQCPDIWFMSLEHLHSEIVKVGRTRKLDKEVIAQIITKAPNMH